MTYPQTLEMNKGPRKRDASFAMKWSTVQLTVWLANPKAMRMLSLIIPAVVSSTEQFPMSALPYLCNINITGQVREEVTNTPGIGELGARLKLKKKLKRNLLMSFMPSNTKHKL